MTVHSSNRDGANLATGKELEFPGSLWGWVFCHFGTHYGLYPVAGMSVREVREKFGWPMSPHAKAVVNRRQLSEDDIIGEVDVLAFFEPPELWENCK